MDEARPSVWPARYMVTPFPFVSLACIFPSISVSPRLTPRYLPEKVNLASGRDLLAAHATGAQTGDGEMVPLAVVIESTFSACG